MPTFGYTASDGISEAPGANQKVVSKFTLTEDGTATLISIRVCGSGGTPNFVAVIYADSAGSPAARKAVTAPLNLADDSTLAWHDLSITSTPLFAGDYWLGFLADAGSFRYAQTNVVNNRKYKGETYSTSPADPFGTPDATDNLQVGIYVTYTPGDHIRSQYIDYDYSRR